LRISFIVIFSVFLVSLIGFYIHFQTDQTRFFDKSAYVFLSTFKVPDSIRRLTAGLTVPKFDFDESLIVKPVNYGSLDFWAAHPKKLDGADVSPTGFNFDRQEDAEVDVFFVHPTTFISSSSWNQSIEKKYLSKNNRAVRYLHEWSLRDQASIFNSCCKVYAPHYRQATLASFLSLRGDGGKALNYAYRDVRAAFFYFLENFNKNRAFVLVGHSQGSMHIIRLLKEEIVGKELMGRMVTAYTVGYPSKPISGLKVCGSKTETMCQISWNTQSIDAKGRTIEPDEICVNPLSWENNDIFVGREKNFGSVSFMEGKEISLNVVGAQCLDGKLALGELKSKNFKYMPFGEGVYHHYDYSLFHMNIRKNIEERVRYFQQK
jgi:hypothetical protein